MVSRMALWLSALRGEGREKKRILQANMVHLLRKARQPAGGDSRSSGVAIAPVT